MDEEDEGRFDAVVTVTRVVDGTSGFRHFAFSETELGVRLGIIITRRGEEGRGQRVCLAWALLGAPSALLSREVVTMKKDVPIEIEIVEAGQPRPQREGPEPSNTKGLRPFPLPDRPVTCPRAACGHTPSPRLFVSIGV